MPRLSEMMKPEDWKKAQERYRKRVEGGKDGVSVSPEIYLTAEFGYYFGWAGVMAILNNEITLDKAFVLLEGARKVWYNKLIEQASATRTSFNSAMAGSKSKSNKAFEEGMRPYKEGAKIDE